MNNRSNRKDSFFDQSFNHEDFFNDSFFPFHGNEFSSQFPSFHSHFSKIHQEMNDIMRQTFGNFHDGRFEKLRNHEIMDENLDKQVEKFGIDSIFSDNYCSEWDYVKELEKQDKNSVSIEKPNIKFYGKSHFYNYSSNGDGKVEERKIVQDSKGNRVESVKKIIGDKVWAKTVKKNNKGEIQEDENMINMDEKDKTEFDNDWKSNKSHKNIMTPIELPKEIINQPVDKNNNPTQFNLNAQDFEKENKANSFFKKLLFWK